MHLVNCHRNSRKLAMLALSGLLLSGCDKAPDLPWMDSRPTVEIRGELYMLIGMGTRNPDGPRTFGDQMVLVKYKPGHEAVIYTSGDTEFVNLETSKFRTTYEMGKEYLVRGYESEPVMQKAADGTEYYQAPRGVDRWIEATYVELLDEEADGKVKPAE